MNIQTNLAACYSLNQPAGIKLLNIGFFQLINLFEETFVREIKNINNLSQG